MEFNSLLRLIDQKLKVHPIYGTSHDGTCRCLKGIDCRSSGKHPMFKEWPLKATTDQVLVRKWLSEMPEANWGLATGELVTVIDADKDNDLDGVLTVEGLIASGILPQTSYVNDTPSGGRHYYYRTPEGVLVGNMVKVLDGVDIRGPDGYVLVEGSKIGDRTYCEIENRPLILENLPYLSQSFINLISSARKRSGAIQMSGVVPEGKRNDTLFRLALKHFKQGNDDQSTLVYILDYNSRFCVPPLDDNEVASITESALRFYNKIKTDNKTVSESGKYAIHDGCISKLCTNPITGEVQQTPLCNFSARILREVTRDDGSDVDIRLTLTGVSKDGIAFPEIEISVTEFSTMSWVSRWGAKAIIYSGNLFREGIRVAIQELSGGHESIKEFRHTGWKIIDGNACYLTASGAINQNGLDPSIRVNLSSDNLQNFCLPSPQTSYAEVIKSIQGSLAAISEDFPDEISLPLFCSIYRAAIGNIVPLDFSVMIVGSTGVRKTTYAGIINGHFGNFDEHHLPESWCSTANALERKAFLVKDGVLLIDDFTPGETDPRTVTYLFRGLSNGSGRSRMTRDGGIRPAHIPRCLLISTGEDIPDGQSIRPRVVILYVRAGDITIPAIDKLKEQSHHFPFAMANFVQWFAGKYEEKKNTLPVRYNQIRSRFVSESKHGRVASNIAHLCLGLEEFLEFAVEKCAMTAEEAYDLMEERAIPAFRRLAEQQVNYQRVSDPIDIFITNIRAALVTGKAHLKGKGNSYPSNPSQWGWKSDKDGNWITSGEHIGWITEDEIWLQPEMAYNMARRLASPNQNIHIHRDALWTRLRDRGLISTSVEEKKNTVKRQVDTNQRPRVLIFKDFSLFRDDLDVVNDIKAPFAPEKSPVLQPFGVTAEELNSKVYRSSTPIVAH
ncbi:MAG: bifunctional DNA primase/polymerase [Bacteriovoracaceae bacterium]